MPLPVSFDLVTGDSLGSHPSWFPRWVTHLLESHTVFEYESWRDVPNEHKLEIYKGLFNMFDLASYQATSKEPNSPWPKVQASIESYCQDRYRDKKYRLRVQFEKAGGSKDLQKSYGAYKDYDKDKWRSLIDNLFTKESFIKRSRINKANRAKQAYPSLHGSQSISSRRYNQIQETGSSSYIEIWDTLHKKNGVFLNEAAEEAFGKIDQAKTDLQCEVGTEGSVDDNEVMLRGLGERSGYIRGVGKRLKHVSPILANSSYMPPPPATSQKIVDLEEKSSQQQDQIIQQQAQIDRMTQEMAQMRELFLQKMGGGSNTSSGSNMNQNSQNDENEDEY